MELSNENIIHDDNPRLRERSAAVSLPLSEEDRELLAAMFQYVKDSQDDELCEQKNLSPAVGLAAIQLGIPKKMIAVVVPGDEEAGEEDQQWALANPKIIQKSAQTAFLNTGEGCLSVIDAHPGAVLRHNHVKVKGYDLLSDQDVVIDVTGYPAIVLQHEIDHLSGILFYDRITDQIPADAVEVE